MNSFWVATRRLAVVGLAMLSLIYISVFWAFSGSIADWTQGSSAPGKRVQSVAAAVNGRLFVFVGFQNEQLEPSNQTFIYDAAADNWAEGSPAPLALSHAAIAADGPTIWMAGGFTGRAAQAPVARSFRYETDGDEWVEGPPLPLAIGGGGLVRSGRNLHYVGGFVARQGVDAERVHWMLDLDEPREWRDAAPMRVATGHAGVVALGQTIYVIGGTTRHGIPASSTRRVSAYDTVNRAWSRVSDLPFPRSYFEAATFVHDGRIYVVGGRDDTSEQLSQAELRDITVYEPSRNVWAHSTGLPVPLRSPVAQAINGEIYVAHGSTYWTEAPQERIWHVRCDDSPGSPCAQAGRQLRIAKLKGMIRSLAKEHVNVLPIRVQKAFYLNEIAER